jgi:hypothetical protein
MEKLRPIDHVDIVDANGDLNSIAKEVIKQVK